MVSRPTSSWPSRARMRGVSTRCSSAHQRRTSSGPMLGSTALCGFCSAEGGVEGVEAGVLLRRKTAQTVKKVTDHYDELRFNTAVAALMELANAMQSHLANGGVRDAEWTSSVRVLV